MGLSTFTEDEGADLDVVRVAWDKLNECFKVVVAGSDTDLVLLVALTPKGKMYISVNLDLQDSIKVFYNIERLVEQHSLIETILLFAHTVTGCDTSCFYG